MLNNIRAEFNSLFLSLGLTNTNRFECRVKNRSEFIDFFTYLSDAIDPQHLEKVPVIFVTGGLSSGKSLAAEAFAKAMDGYYHTPDLQHEPPLNDCFLSPDPEAQFLRKYRCVSAGRAATLLFDSGTGVERHSTEYMRDRFKSISDKESGIIFMTGFALLRNVYIENGDKGRIAIFIDVGRKRFDPNKGRTIKVNVFAPDLQDCPRFQSYVTNLIKTKSINRLSQPDPNEWRNQMGLS